MNSRYYKSTIGGELQDAKRALIEIDTIAVDTTLTIADSGAEVNVATDAITLTLPDITSDNIGMVFLFRNTGADGAVALKLSPAATDGINGTVVNATADSVASGVVNKDITNTKATANNGDYIVLVAGALNKWFITGGVGIWASEA